MCGELYSSGFAPIYIYIWPGGSPILFAKSAHVISEFIKFLPVSQVCIAAHIHKKGIT